MCEVNLYVFVGSFNLLSLAQIVTKPEGLATLSFPFKQANDGVLTILCSLNVGGISNGYLGRCGEQPEPV